jgi:hypothetical protein
LGKARRVVAPMAATPRGLDMCDVVTSLEARKPDDLEAALQGARGQAEDLIKLHKSHLHSDRTACRSPLANQMRLAPHTAASWRMRGVRDAILKSHALAKAGFAAIGVRLFKRGARIVEIVHRVQIAFIAACPHARFIRDLARALKPAPASSVRLACSGRAIVAWRIFGACLRMGLRVGANGCRRRPILRCLKRMMTCASATANTKRV